jgi:hypothetical protein
MNPHASGGGGLSRTYDQANAIFGTVAGYRIVVAPLDPQRLNRRA